MKTVFTVLSFVIFLFLSACVDLSLPVDDSGIPKIQKLSSDIISINDTLIIYGEHFDIPGKGNKLVISNSEGKTIIPSDSVLNWQTNKISVIITEDFQTAVLQIIAFDTISAGYQLVVNRTDQINEVLVPAGSFKMGSISGNFDEFPIHEVTINNSFYISSTEVTQRLYSQIIIFE